jgi:hypothetical protein
MAAQLEYQMIRTPFESFEKVTRNAQKIVVKDMAAVVTTAKNLKTKMPAKPVPSMLGAQKEIASKALQAIVGNLQGLKRKLEDSQKTSERHLQKCQIRVDHLEKLEEAHTQVQEFKKKKLRDNPDAKLLAEISTMDEIENQLIKSKLDRIFVDHLLREGYYLTAQNLVTEAKLQDLVDLDVFLAAKRVLEGLQQGDCSRGLAWCGENRSKLKRINSSLEFSLRLQEFIELLRVQKVTEAIVYAQKNFASWADVHMKEIQQAMTTIAFLPMIIVDLQKTNEPSVTTNNPNSNSAAGSSNAAANTNVNINGTKSTSPPRPAVPSSPPSANPTATTSSTSSAASSSSRMDLDEDGVPPSPRRALSATSTSNANTNANGTSSSNGIANGKEEKSKAEAADGDEEEKKKEESPWERYMSLFSRSRWADLQQQFRSDHCALHGLTTHSLFNITLQTGLSALKTPYCDNPDQANPNCPVCCKNPPMCKLAAKLPVSQRAHSCIVCRITGQIMDERNPPLVLPNGYVYSKNALAEMASKNNGLITCPRSRQQFSLEQCRVAYIL